MSLNLILDKSRTMHSCGRKFFTLSLLNEGYKCTKFEENLKDSGANHLVISHGITHIGFSLSCDLARWCDQRVIRLYVYEPIKVSYHPAKFGCHRHSEIFRIIFYHHYMVVKTQSSIELLNSVFQKASFIKRQL